MLLTVSMAVVFYYSRQMLRQEAMDDATQTLEGTVLQVDNVLRSIEQSVGNVYWDMARHLDQPERMEDYARRTVECNSNIVGCAIAFKPNYYPDREQFMAYVHRRNYDLDELVTSEMFANEPYVGQAWYLEPMNTKKACWMKPLADPKDESFSLLTFCIPITDQNRECVGVFAVDMSIELLSQIVLAAKPSPNSYSVLMDSTGSFIIHPERENLGKTVSSIEENKSNPSLLKAAETMLAGGSGSIAFEKNGKDCYVFYKPSERAQVRGRAPTDLKWSVGIVYPEGDISSDYNHLFMRMLLTTAICLLVFFVLCRIVVGSQLKPLRKLTRRAQDISEGHFDKEVPRTNRHDEIGQFQQHFKLMQDRLALKISKNEELTATLQERRETLRQTYEQMQDANEIKTSFLQNVSNQIIAPSEAIKKSVTNLCDNFQDISLQEARQEVDTIKHQNETILALVNEILNTSKTRKEESHEK